MVTTDNSIFVPDYENYRIQKFTPDGQFVSAWGIKGTNDGQLNKPHSMSGDNNGNIYVTDMNNHRIQKFTSDGQFVSKWGSEGTVILNSYKIVLLCSH
jgi:DNA-binding beta-propeller fold protein YncE